MTVEECSIDERYGPRRLTVELTNSCNLHCGYCLRDEDALYHTRAQFLPLEFLRRVIRESRDAAGVAEINFTGGEPSLHPQFAELIHVCGEEGVKASFVTNGWNFEKILPALLAHRKGLNHVAFSLDGPTAKSHDGWRGQGSFVRLIRAFTRCHHHGLPFIIKTSLRRDTFAHLEEIAMFAARMGAAALAFAHVMPTSAAYLSDVALSVEERRQAEEEIGLLAKIFRMKVSLDVGYYNVDPAPPCSPLAGTSYNIDYRGRLTLCCNLSGFRGGDDEQDIVVDLNSVSFGAALGRFNQLRDLQLERRNAALSDSLAKGATADLYLGSPCLFCLGSFGKLPWHSRVTAGGNGKTALPVLNTYASEAKG